MAEPVPALPPAPPRREPVPWPHQAKPAIVPSSPTGDSSRGRLSRWEDDIRAAPDRAIRAATRAAAVAARNIGTFADERPVQFVLAVAAVAFTAGVGLRIWRSNHD